MGLVMNVEKKLNLAEALALAVIRGDLVAAYALADMLIEQKNTEGGTPMQKAAREIRASKGQVAQTYEVYSSKEFRAFCEKFGIAYDLGTVNITIHLPLDGLMSVVQEYRTHNMPQGP